MQRRKSTGCVATMIFTPFGESPITGTPATPSRSPAPTRAPPSRLRSCVLRQPRSQFDWKQWKRYPTTHSGEAFVLQPLSPARTCLQCVGLRGSSSGQPSFAAPDLQQTTIDAPAPGDGRDVHVGFCAFGKDPRLSVQFRRWRRPVITSIRLTPSCLASSMTPSMAPARSPTIPFHSCE